MTSSSTLTFVNDNTKLRIEVNYNVMFHLSKLVSMMAEDDSQEREIMIPSFPGYLQDNVNAHLQHIVHKISMNDISHFSEKTKNHILEEPLQTSTHNPLHVGMYRVMGNIDNLTIYLLLINWLDIPLLF
jgi:hypothetical protein